MQDQEGRGDSREGRAEELSGTSGADRSRAGEGTSREDANKGIQRTLSRIRSSMFHGSG